MLELFKHCFILEWNRNRSDLGKCVFCLFLRHLQKGVPKELKQSNSKALSSAHIWAMGGKGSMQCPIMSPPNFLPRLQHRQPEGRRRSVLVLPSSQHRSQHRGSNSVHLLLCSRQPCTALTPRNEEHLDQPIHANRLMVVTTLEKEHFVDENLLYQRALLYSLLLL